MRILLQVVTTTITFLVLSAVASQIFDRTKFKPGWLTMLFTAIVALSALVGALI